MVISISNVKSNPSAGETYRYQKPLIYKTLNMGKDLKITIAEIKGNCPVYQTGDSFFLDSGYVLDPKKSCRVCMHSLASILPYHVALSHGIAPIDIGLNKKNEDRAFLQCLDPCRHTGGGTVIFEVEII